jgi:hypothetical protein
MHTMMEITATGRIPGTQLKLLLARLLDLWKDITQNLQSVVLVAMGLNWKPLSFYMLRTQLLTRHSNPCLDTTSDASTFPTFGVVNIVEWCWD